MRTIRTTMMAVALAAVPGLAFGACGGHESAEADGLTVATQTDGPQTPAPDQTVKPDDQQAMGDTAKSDEKAD